MMLQLIRELSWKADLDPPSATLDLAAFTFQFSWVHLMKGW